MRRKASTFTKLTYKDLIGKSPASRSNSITNIAPDRLGETILSNNIKLNRDPVEESEELKDPEVPEEISIKSVTDPEPYEEKKWKNQYLPTLPLLLVCAALIDVCIER